MIAPDLQLLDVEGLRLAQAAVTRHHYLHRPVDVRSTPEAYAVHLPTSASPVGYLIVGRPEATRCYPWYGSVEDVALGRAQVTRWQVLNLARVWLSPDVQMGGSLYSPRHLPGFHDRGGEWRSVLASTVVRALADVVVRDYLVRRPPCFLDEPYELKWLLSYCDTRLHRGTLYRAAGFELHRTNERGLQTWRLPLRPLTADENADVCVASINNERSRAFRARRAQMVLEGVA